MKACWCALAGTEACKYCSNRSSESYTYTFEKRDIDYKLIKETKNKRRISKKGYYPF